MKNSVLSTIFRLRIWRDDHAQDLIEYALISAFIAVAAGAIMPGVTTAISKVFSRVSNALAVVGS